MKTKQIGEEKHIHKFIHNGGGMMMVGNGLPCDDSYKCECGEIIIVKSNLDAQLQLPKIIYGEISDEGIDKEYEKVVIKNLPN